MRRPPCSNTFALILAGGLRCRVSGTRTDGARLRLFSRRERDGALDIGRSAAREGAWISVFKVQNADFIADKLASELLPDQEFREVAKNAEEAIRRRAAGDGLRGGRIEFDVDWALFASTDPGVRYLCCADDGDGMTRSELERYMTTLAVHGAGDNQSLTGNQGMGLKISGPPDTAKVS